MRWKTTLLVACGVALLPAPHAVRASDHGDSPQVRVDPRVDIADLYAFQSPADAANVVLIMTVAPLAGITTPDEFATGAKYEFAVDTNNDAVEDFVLRFTFNKPDRSHRQKMKAQLFGTKRFVAMGKTGDTLNLAQGGQLMATKFDDPFFFDLIAFKNGNAYTNPGVNFFRGLNVMGIVAELPRSTFGTDHIGVWARTFKGHRQIDRMGRPAINTILIPAAKKDLFNSTKPVNDIANFRQDLINSITALGNAPAAPTLAGSLLPDILAIDTSSATGFLNGRRLQDDVIDAELGLLTNGAVTTDNVANDSTFSAVFPYLAGPNP